MHARRAAGGGLQRARGAHDQVVGGQAHAAQVFTRDLAVGAQIEMQAVLPVDQHEHRFD
ncbi:hypothetical protein D3C85_1659990 [compost metagenome]